MRKGIIALVLIAFSVQQPQPVEAGAFATEVTQLLNHGQLVMQYIRQGEQLANEIKMLEDMLRNVKPLPGQTFGPIAADINALAAIVQGGQALAYSLGNLDALYRRTYPGYGYNANAYYVNYKNWSQTSLDTTLGALRAAGLQGLQLQSEQSVLNSLRGMAQTSDGRMQALQVLGQINEQQVQQLMKLRELMMADMSSKRRPIRLRSFSMKLPVKLQRSASSRAGPWSVTAKSTRFHDNRKGDNERPKMTRLFILGLVTACLALMTGCTREPRSAVVEKVEQGGCGPLSGVSTDAIQKCLAQRRQLAIEVDQMCKPIRETAPARWNDSTEGRACTAARNLAFWRSGPVQGDGKTYDPTK